MTNLEVARKYWQHEQWGEPRDERQRDLWVKFFLGDVSPDSEWRPRHWIRPLGWVEELVRE